MTEQKYIDVTNKERKGGGQ